MSDKRKIEELEQVVKDLNKEILLLTEENNSLWDMLEEKKASTSYMGDRLVEAVQQHLDEEWLKKLKPHGEA